jgi:cobyrinic acid a,c-diamide synthase
MLTDAGGTVHAMAGLLPVETSFATRKLHLGYRQATWADTMPFADAGARSWGHEYHHATICGGEPGDLAAMTDGEANVLPPAGHRRGFVTGTFFHVIG